MVRATAAAATLDIAALPEVVRLVEEVRRTGAPLLLRRGDEDLAVLSPAPPARPTRRPRGKRPTQAQIDAALATFGTWTDLDAGKLLRELDEARGDATPPVEL
jgi:hypothetical protein